MKARAALYLIKDAEEQGLLTPGKPGTIVEATAGNTGISLAEIASARGYECVIVIPKTQSQEKKDALRYAGAQLVEVDAKPYTNPNNYVHFGRRLAEHLPGSVFTNQFDNVANRAAHVATTGPEIWAQLDGKVDGFSCAVGTGGTLAGTAQFLRSVSDSVKIGLTDPKGAKLVRYYNDGELKAEGGSITEGIGQGRITANLEGFTPDYAFEIADEEVRFEVLPFAMAVACFFHVRCPARRQRRLTQVRGEVCFVLLCFYLQTGARRCVQADGRGGAVSGDVVRHQRGRGNACGARAGAWAQHCDGAVRPGDAVQREDVQPGVSAREGVARAAVAGGRSRRGGCLGGGADKGARGGGGGAAGGERGERELKGGAGRCSVGACISARCWWTRRGAVRAASSAARGAEAVFGWESRMVGQAL